MIAHTYKEIGIQGVTVTKREIDDWIKMTDLNNDGKISLEEYELLII